MWLQGKKQSWHSFLLLVEHIHIQDPTPSQIITFFWGGAAADNQFALIYA